MAEVTSFTAARIEDIEDAVIDSGGVNSLGHMVLNRHDTTVIDIGPVTAPVGSVLMFAAAVTPSGWLLCNGQAISRSTYSDLFTAIGTTYGSGNGTTTFNVPNMEARFPRMEAATRGGTGGAATVTHNHTTPDHAHNLIGGSPQAHARIFSGGSPVADFNERATSVASWTPSNGVSYGGTAQSLSAQTTGTKLAGMTNSDGGGTSGDASPATVPPYLNLNFIIKT